MDGYQILKILINLQWIPLIDLMKQTWMICRQVLRVNSKKKLNLRKMYKMAGYQISKILIKL